MTEVPAYRDLSRLGRLLKLGLGFEVAMAAVGLWSGWVEIDLLQRAAGGAVLTEAEAGASDARQTVLGGVGLLVFVVNAVLFLRWTYRANQNARSLGAAGMRFTPAWAVGWYFVPIATLWKPYQAMTEIFRASCPDPAMDWQQTPRPGILPLWWTLWIVSSLIGQVALRVALRAETVEQLLVGSWITFAADLLAIPLGLVAIAMVTTLHGWQSEKHRRLAAGAAAPSMERTPLPAV